MFTLHNVLNQILEREDDWRLRVIKNWRDIVGDLCTKMRLEKVKGETLIIGVYDPHWMQELFLLSRMIMKTINQKLGGEYVKKLRFVLARGAKKKVAHRRVKSSSHSVIPRSIRSMESRHKNALCAIKDKKLQHVLQKLFQTCQV